MTVPPDAGLLVRRWNSDGKWDSPEMTAYDNEDHLQRIVAAAPERVPGVPDGALTVREFSTSAGPADVCIVGPDGSITVVECKLASNSERRRMVIGQVIDYASAIWLDGETAFREQWARQGGADLDELSEGELSQNISDGRIALCLAVDRIDADLRRLIEYLNKITRDEISVTALQLAYARHGDVEILIPSTYGAEIAAAKARSSKKSTAWTTEAFLDALVSKTDRDLAVRLFELLESLDERRGTHDDLWFGSRPGGGIFFYPYGLRISPFQIWVNKAGRLMAYGNWFQYSGVHRHHPGFAELATLVGQDHESTAKSFPVANFDINTLWGTALRCAKLINDSAQATTRSEL